ncbi:hypothetical protein EAE96_005195 [Botrytis aclada]|nr:hypothetical protein EAE96_005195 [Botrytis aclada]
MTNKRRSSLSAVENLVGEQANKRQRNPIPDIITPVEVSDSMEKIENAEKTQVALLPSQNWANTEIDYQEGKFSQEILRMICSHVHPAELSNLRFVSKAFSNAAAVHMFKEISFKFEESSFENLTNIAYSSQLKRHVSRLTCEFEFTEYAETEDLETVHHWCPHQAEFHLFHHNQLIDAITRLPSLHTIRLNTNAFNGNSYVFEGIFPFDSFWYFFKLALDNVSNLRRLEIQSARLECNSFQERRNSNWFSKTEMETLEKLKHLYLQVNNPFAPLVPALLDCMKNLRSLSLGETHEVDFMFGCSVDVRDFSELVNPSTIFPSLESLELEYMYLNEQYFQGFLLNHAHSLRSLSLYNLRIEITKEEFETKEYLKSNSWIRMFYFFAQSLHLENIGLHGALHTSHSGYWDSDCFCEDGCQYHCSSSILSLQNFITHVEGSSFPLPHPDEDLRNVDMTKYSYPKSAVSEHEPIFPCFHWTPDRFRSGRIRLLEKEPFKPSTFKGFLDWIEPESDSDSDADDGGEEEAGEEEAGEEEEEEEEAEEEEEEAGKGEENPTQRAAFDYVLTQARANINLWSDEEKQSLMNTLLEGFAEGIEWPVGAATSIESETH